MNCLHVRMGSKKRSICLLGARTPLKKAGLQQAPRCIVQERKLQHLARKSFLVARVGEQTGKRSQNNQLLTGSTHKRLPLWDEYINMTTRENQRCKCWCWTWKGSTQTKQHVKWKIACGISGAIGNSHLFSLRCLIKSRSLADFLWAQGPFFGVDTDGRPMVNDLKQTRPGPMRFSNLKHLPG